MDPIAAADTAAADTAAADTAAANAGDPPAAGEAPPPAPADDESQSGFQRDEMFASPLVGTVKAYDGHLFLCHKGPESWPKDVGNHGGDLLPRFLCNGLKSRKNDLPRNIVFTACQGSESESDGPGFPNGDVLLFPDMIRYRRLTSDNVDEFIENVLVKGKEWAGGKEPLSGSYVFVCAHASRDKRCGVCGPVLVKKFEEEIESRGLNGGVFVRPCSHIGGHKYAGNVIIYGQDRDGLVTGHWYGYVTPDDVPTLIDQHIGKGEVIYRLWRGQMGVSPEDQIEVHKNAVRENYKALSLDDAETGKNGKDEILNANGSQTEVKENASSCCQGAKGVTCCRDATIEDAVGSLPNGDGKSGHSNKVKAWLNAWDKSDTFMALGIIGVAASVAVAYTIYRRSG